MHCIVWVKKQDTDYIVIHTLCALLFPRLCLRRQKQTGVEGLAPGCTDVCLTSTGHQADVVVGLLSGATWDKPVLRVL